MIIRFISQFLGNRFSTSLQWLHSYFIYFQLEKKLIHQQLPCVGISKRHFVTHALHSTRGKRMKRKNGEYFSTARFLPRICFCKLVDGSFESSQNTYVSSPHILEKFTNSFFGRHKVDFDGSIVPEPPWNIVEKAGPRESVVDENNGPVVATMSNHSTNRLIRCFHCFDRNIWNLIQFLKGQINIMWINFRRL